MKILYYIKNIGLLLLYLGIILATLQFIGMPTFPYSTIILVISVIMQLVGYKESFWFFKNRVR